MKIGNGIFVAKLLKMIRIGVIRERKKLPDERVPLIPRQCTYIEANYPGIKIVVEPSPIRCYTDAEYQAEGIELNEDLSDCDILLGVKEVPADSLVPDKTYFFFSHTKKKQPYNQGLMRALIEKRIRMIDYECLTHSDEQRILGFGLYAGIVGAHNGLLTYGKKFGLYDLPAAHAVKSFKDAMAEGKSGDVSESKDAASNLIEAEVPVVKAIPKKRAPVKAKSTTSSVAKSTAAKKPVVKKPAVKKTVAK